MKIRVTPLLLLLLAIVAGCSAVQRNYAFSSSMIAVEASVLKNQYKKVESTLRAVQAEKGMFTDDEWRSLLNVDATIDMLILKYEALISLQSAEVTLADVSFMYQLAVEGYTMGREVIMAHWSEFQPSTQIMLNSFDTAAQETSGRVTELLNNPSNSNINEALTLISGILSIGVKMLGLAVAI